MSDIKLFQLSGDKALELEGEIRPPRELLAAGLIEKHLAVFLGVRFFGLPVLTALIPVRGPKLAQPSARSRIAFVVRAMPQMN